MKTMPKHEHCTIDDIGISMTGEDAKPIIEAVDLYLHKFAATGGKCPKCDAQLGGWMGSFVWGLIHGEGYCSGGLNGPCDWPCRALHRIKDLDGKEILGRALPVILAYHPEFITQESFA